MRFKAKREPWFYTLTLVILAGIGVLMILPPLLDPNLQGTEEVAHWIITAVLLGFLCWTFFGLAYRFDEEHLQVKGGPIRSRIPYHEITRAVPTDNWWFGYRMMASRQGIEIFYRTGLMGSVKISPEREAEFLNELKKRAPHITIETRKGRG